MLLVLSPSRQREGLPQSSVLCLVCMVVGLLAAGVAEAKPFPPLWGAWLDPVELGWHIQPGSGVGSPSPLSHLPEFLDLTSVFSLTCYLLDTACTWSCLGKGCGVKPNCTETSTGRLNCSCPTPYSPLNLRKERLPSYYRRRVICHHSPLVGGVGTGR